jgi:hypothetical protein
MSDNNKLTKIQNANIAIHKLYITLSDLSEAGVMPAATVTAHLEQPAFVDLLKELQHLLYKETYREASQSLKGTL